MVDLRGKMIAVDFDGTIVEHKYPKIGQEMQSAFTVLMALQQKGHKLILWTYRRGALLQQAVDYCRENGVEFYAVNENFPNEPTDDKRYSRKLIADIFIDDRNIGGFPGWENIWNMLHPDGGDFRHQINDPAAHKNLKTKESRKWWHFFTSTSSTFCIGMKTQKLR